MQANLAPYAHAHAPRASLRSLTVCCLPLLLICAARVSQRELRRGRLFHGPSANHNAIAATRTGLLLLSHPAASPDLIALSKCDKDHADATPLQQHLPVRRSAFDFARRVDKMHGEFLTGVIVNRLAAHAAIGAGSSGDGGSGGSGGSTSPASSFSTTAASSQAGTVAAATTRCPPLQWRAPTPSASHSVPNLPEAGFYKLHGSSFSWILPCARIMCSHESPPAPTSLVICTHGVCTHISEKPPEEGHK